MSHPPFSIWHGDFCTDPAENVGAKLIKSVAVQSDRTAGDGTTTSTLMTQVLINRGYRLIQTGRSPPPQKDGEDGVVVLA